MSNELKPNEKHATRRGFVGLLLAGGAAATASAQQTPAPTNAIPQNTSVPKRRGTQAETPAIGEVIEFAWAPASPKARPFEMTEVRLLPSRFLTAQNASFGYMRRLPVNRLVHNFRINAGLPSSAEPFGGWEKPDCELRGHFTGHYLSACALMYASTGDEQIKAKGEEIVAELAACQKKLSGGYLSAFPISFFDRLNARQRVWAPFYTIHKIMAGMYDMSQHCGSKQAMDVLRGMADWADHWTAPIPEPHMQDILNTEYGGMNEVLYNLAATTHDDRYAKVGDRFTKKWFFNPLAARRDQLRGLHANTHIPQVIGAARRYEISSDERFHDIADFFWYEITSARAYVTGGTSNNEGWLVEPRRLNEELKVSAATTECCCAYNMLKLTRHLYTWTADPRYFDYYERTLYNHRIAAIEATTGHTQYYLSIVPGAWKTFNSEDDSFWCCTGTGVEEFAKLNNSIYFHDDQGLYVNLFIPSELNWREKGIRVRQENSFPDTASTTLTLTVDQPRRMPLRLRIPYWVSTDVAVKVNGRPVEASATPGSYFTLIREWRSGDKVEMELPMSIHVEKMPDEPSTQAVLYGPLVLAGQLGSSGLNPNTITGEMGPDLEKQRKLPVLHASNDDVASSVKPGSDPLTFQATGQDGQVTLAPFDRTFGERYSVYWSVES